MAVKTPGRPVIYRPPTVPGKPLVIPPQDQRAAASKAQAASNKAEFERLVKETYDEVPFDEKPDWGV